MSASAPTRSPWSSVNDMLIQNKCWLCEEVFPRGKVKKVFQISQLLDYFNQRLSRERELHMNNGVGIGVPELQSRHLRNAYERFREVALSHATEDEFRDKLTEELKEVDVELWMSGLICDIQPICKQELRYFIPDAPQPPQAELPTKKHKTGDIMGMMTFANKECPPGCNCDNPWPFMS